MGAETYQFEPETYDALAQAGVSPLSVTDVLYGGRVVRRHIGSSLQVAGTDNAGVWLAISMIETDDDQYVITGARYLAPDEITTLARIFDRKDQR